MPGASLQAWRALGARHRAGLHIALLVVPALVAGLVLAPSSELGMTTMVGLPLLGDGHVPTWVILALYAAVVTAPLLSWEPSAMEVGTPCFERRSLLFPHVLSLALGMITLGCLWSLPTSASAVFWVSSSMAAANLGALLLRQHSWVGLLVGAMLVLALLLQHRIEVSRGAGEAAAAAVGWGGLTLAAAWRQHQRQTRR